MAWIESHQTLGTHPKLFRLCQQLNITDAQAVGHLQYFWWWCIDYAPNGDVSRFDALQIARAARWMNGAGEFLEAIVLAGFLDRDGEQMMVHDWLDFCGELVKQRCRRLKEKRGSMKGKRGSRKGNCHSPSIPPSSSLDSSSSPSYSPSTQPNQDARARFAAFWAAYPERNGRKLFKAKTETLFLALSPEEREHAIEAAKVYGRHCAQANRLPKDPHRFLKGQDGELWRDFVPQPNVSPRSAGRSPGNPVARGPEAPTEPVGPPPPEARAALRRLGVRVGEDP